MKKTLPPSLFMIAFVSVIVVGIIKQLSVEVILLRSLLAGIVFLIIGILLSYVGSSLVTEHFEEQRKRETQKKVEEEKNV